MEARAPHQKRCSPEGEKGGGKAGKGPAEGTGHGLEGVGTLLGELEGLVERRRLPTWKVMKAPTMAESRGCPGAPVRAGAPWGSR